MDKFLPNDLLPNNFYFLQFRPQHSQPWLPCHLHRLSCEHTWKESQNPTQWNTCPVNISKWTLCMRVINFIVFYFFTFLQCINSIEMLCVFRRLFMTSTYIQFVQEINIRASHKAFAHVFTALFRNKRTTLWNQSIYFISKYEHTSIDSSAKRI